MKAAALGLALGLASMAGCFSPSDVDTGPLHGTLSGACAPEGTTILVVQAGETIDVDAPPGTELPHTGASHTGGHLRDGGWFLYGYTCATAGCQTPERFRYCTTKRRSWFLALTCVDGLARPVCSGTISE